MAIGTFWKRLSPKWLSIYIQAFSLIAIFFEGYDQGMTISNFFLHELIDLF
jgi:hypothetical protein